MNMNRWYAWIGLFLLVGEALAQTAPVLDPKKFTDRRISIRQMRSNDPSCFVLLKNGQPQVVGRDYRKIFFYAPPDSRGGVFHIEVDFGYWQPGDVLQVEDRCRGEQSAPMIVQDDYAYLTIPAGPGHAGNGLHPGSQNPPYANLNQPMLIGQCAPLTLNSHVLFPVVIGMATDVGAERTTGAFRLNGQSLETVPMQVYTSGDPTQFQWGASGNLTADGYLRLETIPVFDGKSPFELEYKHNGMADITDFWMFLGGIGVKEIKNHSFQVIKRNYLGDLVEERYEGDFTEATFRITFTENQYQVWLNGQLISSLDRFIVFYTEAGELSSRDPLPYGSSVTFHPQKAGAQTVGVLIDGAVTVRQRLQIADPLSLVPNIQGVRCAGESNGQVALLPTGGLAPFTYRMEGGIDQSSAQFGGLSAGTYVFRVQDASGCVADVQTQVSSPHAVQLVVTDSVATSCLGQATGQVTLAAQGGQGMFQYRLLGRDFQEDNQIVALPAGTLVFEARDQAGCTSHATATLGFRSAWTIQPQLTPASCHGTATGQLILESLRPSSGTPRFSLNQLDYQSSPMFSQLAAGTYQVWAEDAGCQIHLTDLVISQPTPVSLVTQQVENARCFGESSGSWQVNASGGVGPYQFSTNGNQFTASNDFRFANLAAGTYKVWVRDANGCLQEALQAIAQPTPLQWDLTEQVAISCPGASTGRVVAAASGGNGGFTYFLNTQSSHTPQWENLTAGMYTVQVQDQLGCQASFQTEVTEPPALRVGANMVAPIACFGLSTGGISLQGEGGTPPYQYSLGGEFQGSSLFSGLRAGSYTLRVQDSRGCLQIAPVLFALDQPTRVTATFEIQPVTCPGGQDGGWVVIGSGGQGGYQYAEDGIQFKDSGIFENKRGGTYTVWIRDQAGCSHQQSVILPEPDPLQFVEWMVEDVRCHGGATGKLSWQVKGGTAPYTFALSGSTYHSFFSLDTLREGTYQILGKDAQGCAFQSPEKQIQQPARLAISVDGLDEVRCFGGHDGQIRLRAVGGVAPYEFALEGQIFTEYAIFKHLSAKEYKLAGRDRNGCMQSLAVTVTQPEAYELSIQDIQPATCFGEATGQIAVQHRGGTAPYKAWILSDTLRQVQARFLGLHAASYQVESQDARGCRFTLSEVSVGQPAPIQLTWQEVRSVDCEDYRRGKLHVVASGSHAGFGYQLTGHSVSGNPYAGQFSTNGIFDEVPVGEFRVTAIDQKGCSFEQPVRVMAQNTSIRFKVHSTSPTHCQQSDGTIQIQDVTGGRGNYSFFLNRTQGTDQFSGLSSGVYQVTVRDSLCEFRQEIRLEAPGTPKVTYTALPIACSTAEAEVSLFIEPTVGESYSVQWPGQVFGAATSFRPVPPGITEIQVRAETSGCLSHLSLEITPQNKGNLNWVERISLVCHGHPTGVLEVRGDRNLQFRLGTGSWGESPRFSTLLAGVYQLFSQNQLGCQDSIQATLHQPPLLQGESVITPNVCHGDATGRIQVFATGGVGSYQYRLGEQSWQSIAQFDQLKAGNYTVYLQDQNGCQTPLLAQILEPSPVRLTTTQVPVRCYGEFNGEVNVLANGGTPGYQFRRSGDAWQSSGQFAGFGIGQYTFEVRDANQCQQMVEVEISQPTQLEIDLTAQVSPRCFEGRDGFIEVQAKGGNSGYQYRMGNQPWRFEPRFADLGKGTFQIDVRDGKGCFAQTGVATLTHPSAIQVRVLKQEPRCFGEANGALAWEIKGGIGPYLLEVEGQSLGIRETRFDLDQVAAGQYSYRVQDAQQCEWFGTIGVSQPTAINLKTVITPVLCFGGATGQIQVLGQGATPPYTFALEPIRTTGPVFQTQGIFSALSAQMYEVWVRDSQGCQHSQAVQMPQPPPLRLTLAKLDSVRCFGETNGQLTVLAQGGVAGYQFSIGKNRIQNTPTFDRLGAGLYSVEVRDFNQCTTQLDSIRLGQPNRLELSVQHQMNPRCIDEDSGEITLGSQGGNGFTLYSRDQQAFQSEPHYRGLAAGSYAFQGRDWKGCLASLPIISLVRPSPIVAQIAIQSPTCVGDFDGTMAIFPTGGAGGYQATWWPSDFPDLKKVWLKDTIQGLQAGVYSVRIQDVLGCEVNLSTRIPAPSPLVRPVLHASGLDSILVCAKEWVTLNAGNPGQRFSWTHNGQTLSEQSSILRTQEPGMYTVRIANESGCTLQQTLQVVHRPTTLAVDFLMPSEVFAGDTLVCLDITRPIPTQWRWTYPNQAFVLANDGKRLVTQLNEPGEGRYILSVSDGSCWYEKEQVVRVMPRAVMLEDLPLIQSVHLRPNPSSGRFQLEVTLRRPAPVEIRGIRQVGGQVITTQQGNGQAVYVWTFDWQVPSGIYLWVVQAEGQQVTQRFIIQR